MAAPPAIIGVAPNKGDTAVPCQPADVSQTVYGEPWTCDYTLDVSGGWYDAGDHGKYVVNGGISVGQLLAAFRRASRSRRAGRAFGDGKLCVSPSTAIACPTCSTRRSWELDWMLKMMVPDGRAARRHGAPQGPRQCMDRHSTAALQ